MTEFDAVIDDDLDDLPEDDDLAVPGIPEVDTSMPEPDLLATDSLEALRDQELGGAVGGEPTVDPAKAALLEAGSLDAEDDDLDDLDDEEELDGLGRTRDVMFDSVDDDEEEDEDDDY